MHKYCTHTWQQYPAAIYLMNIIWCIVDLNLRGINSQTRWDDQSISGTAHQHTWLIVAEILAAHKWDPWGPRQHLVGEGGRSTKKI
jgi:hypothetical protein